MTDLFGTRSAFGRFSANSQQNFVLFLIDSQQNFSSKSENIRQQSRIELRIEYKLQSFE